MTANSHESPPYLEPDKQPDDPVTEQIVQLLQSDTGLSSTVAARRLRIALLEKGK